MSLCLTSSFMYFIFFFVAFRNRIQKGKKKENYMKIYVYKFYSILILLMIFSYIQQEVCLCHKSVTTTSEPILIYIFLLKTSVVYNIYTLYPIYLAIVHCDNKKKSYRLSVWHINISDWLLITKFWELKLLV